ncbi:hypothetical protein SACS_0994 [Parasaccharibacter apium]|uniref:Uncharacterized protein n=1 Tax=Parasaccharibacter apium TaxID=1510841 RepID=A0A7U7G5X1_9PROT|nr:hypothetical protein SACS_0994 [Parasaccharibacter apium]
MKCWDKRKSPLTEGVTGCQRKMTASPQEVNRKEQKNMMIAHLPVDFLICLP